MEFKNLSLPVKIGLSISKHYHHVYPCKEAKKPLKIMVDNFKVDFINLNAIFEFVPKNDPQFHDESM